MRPSLAVLFFIATMCFGLWLNDRSWNGQVYVYVGEDRAPAAVRNLEEYSALDHSALYRSVQSQLMTHAKVIYQPGRLGVQLGHPLVSHNWGGKEFACQVQDHSGVFDRVELTFIGAGVAAEGVPPRMIVDGSCRSQEDLNLLDTLWIPVSTILAAPARDQIFKAQDDSSTQIRVQGVPDQWPEDWVLWTIRLYSSTQSDQALNLDTEQLRKAQPHLLSLGWKVQ